MTKYARKPALTESQECEIFPILDAALTLKHKQAILHKCPTPRSRYLSRILNGERYRNAILSISTYSSDNPLYGKGLYYNLVIEPCSKGLLVANVENPPNNITMEIIKCAATKKPVPLSFPIIRVQSRLNKLKERHPTELGSIYIDAISQSLKYAVPLKEEMLIVDIDVNPAGAVPTPTAEQRAKTRK